MDLSQSEDIDYRAYSMLPTAPLLDVCSVCKKPMLTDLQSLPCRCLVPIHLDCISVWKRDGKSCPVCGEYADDRCTNTRWALYCVSTVALLCLVLWVFFSHVAI
jgi:hypothetical protein